MEDVRSRPGRGARPRRRTTRTPRDRASASGTAGGDRSGRCGQKRGHCPGSGSPPPIDLKIGLGICSARFGEEPPGLKGPGPLDLLGQKAEVATELGVGPLEVPLRRPGCPPPTKVQPVMRLSQAGQGQLTVRGAWRSLQFLGSAVARLDVLQPAVFSVLARPMVAERKAGVPTLPDGERGVNAPGHGTGASANPWAAAWRMPSR